MLITGGRQSGTDADASAVLRSAGRAQLFVSGSRGLEIRGGTGNVLYPVGLGKFPAVSGLFQLVGDDTMFEVKGNAYPIEVTGLITLIEDPSLAPALLISGAPPVNLDALQSE